MTFMKAKGNILKEKKTPHSYCPQKELGSCSNLVSKDIREIKAWNILLIMILNLRILAMLMER
jgi:hypothetical protein